MDAWLISKMSISFTHEKNISTMSFYRQPRTKELTSLNSIHYMKIIISYFIFEIKTFFTKKIRFFIKCINVFDRKMEVKTLPTSTTVETNKKKPFSFSSSSNVYTTYTTHLLLATWALLFSRLVFFFFFFLNNKLISVFTFLDLAFLYNQRCELSGERNVCDDWNVNVVVSSTRNLLVQFISLDSLV